MKHITSELEEKIRSQISSVNERMMEHLEHRKSVEKETGEFPPAGLNEHEAAAWRRALNWVLHEAACD